MGTYLAKSLCIGAHYAFGGSLWNKVKRHVARSWVVCHSGKSQTSFRYFSAKLRERERERESSRLASE
jgi:hypothetical protein